MSPVPQRARRRLAYLVSHPIQYQAPLLSRLAGCDEVDLDVAFLSDVSTRKHFDPGFGASFAWDVPLTEGYACRFLSSAPKVSFWSPFLPDIWQRIDGEGIDALWVHGWNQATQLIAIAEATRRGIPVLLRGESKPEARRGLVRKAVLKTLLQRVAACLAIGTENRLFYEQLGVGQERIYPVPYGVDNEHFERGARSAAQHREDSMRELGLDPARPVILFASKLIERKRPLDLVEAYRRLTRFGNEAEDAHRAQLVIVGDGPLRAAVEKAARGPGWGSIHVLGFRNQSELPRLYELSDVFVLPSAYETWGLVVNEAMCAGTPVIASDGVGCARDLIREGETGFTYPVGDVEALARCLQRVLEDRPRAHAMGQRAAAHVRRFGIDAACDGILNAVAEVCAV